MKLQVYFICRIISPLFSFFVVGVFFFFLPTCVYAQAYGEGIYGSNEYGASSTPTPTPNPALTVTGSSQTEQQTPSPSSCVDEKPRSAPTLFQIDVKDRTATLFFISATEPLTQYVIAFGTTASFLEYGATFDFQSERGVQKVTVSLLKPSTTYYFRIRAGNGCAPGDWSRIMFARTNASSRYPMKSFYAFSSTPQYQSLLYTRPSFMRDNKLSVEKKIDTQQNLKEEIQPKQHTQTAQEEQQTKTEQPKQSFFSKVKSFIRKLVKK